MKTVKGIGMKQVALVTGGSRGIGLGISRSLIKAGFDLAVNGVRSEHEVAPVLDELRAMGADVVYCQGDISVKSDRESILKTVEKYYGTFNVLVNNGGIAPKVRADLLETTEESFEALLKVNLQGTYFLTQLAAKKMAGYAEETSGYRGCIITVSSISSQVASINRGEYCVAKAGLSMMTKLFAVRMGEYGIPVYEIQPGIIASDMTKGVKEKYDSLFNSGIAIDNRWGQPEDVGAAVAALAKGEIPYATGQVLVIDGGLTIQRL